MARLETTFLESSRTVEKMSKSRRQCASAVNELGDQITTFAMSETYTPLANGFKRLARGMKVDADIMAVQVSWFSISSPFTVYADSQSRHLFSRSATSFTSVTLSSTNLQTLDQQRRRSQTATQSLRNIERRSRRRFRKDETLRS